MKHLSFFSILVRMAVIAIFTVGIVSACANKPKPKTDVPIAKTGEIRNITLIDTFCMHMRMQDSLLILSLNEQLTQVVMQLNAAVYENEILKKEVSGLRIRNDSIHESAFLARYKLERVRYYLNICMRNPSQDKFLKGWIRRAVE